MEKLANFLILGVSVSALIYVTSGELTKKFCKTVPECEKEARTYLLGEYEKSASKLCNKDVTGEWNYVTNLTSKEAQKEAEKANIAYSNFKLKTWNETIRHWNYKSFNDDWIKRQLKFLNVIDEAALDPTDLSRYNEVLSEMSKIYGTAKICPFNNQNCNVATEGLRLDPDIEEIISTSRNSAELAYVWKAWRDATGKKIRKLYNEFVNLSNKAAKANGLADTSELWLLRYESDNFKSQIKSVWQDVKGLYEKLYGYVRYRLRQWYPCEFSGDDDPIPEHLLGNMWAQQWDNIYNIVIPFPSVPGFDVTPALQKRFGSSGHSAATELFKLANKFFVDLDLKDMSVAYGEKAVIVRPKDREVECHASAWDFCNGKDFRIKMCTKIEFGPLLVAFHELGHIQYFTQYSHLPITYREGANPGFHEAIGDVITLSVATTKHMIKLGLMENTAGSKELTLNYLMKIALEKVAFLPFGYIIDAYRWQIFDGSLSRCKFTKGWLKIRNEVQGLIPPVTRSEEDFDPGSKYHVPGNVEYIRYFVSVIIQFQIHKALCIKAGQYVSGDPSKPLYNCDIDGNLEAGAVLKELLEAGASKQWQDILEKATGSRNIDATAIKEYFEPLIEYLDEQQTSFNYSITWKKGAWKERYDNNGDDECSL